MSENASSLVCTHAPRAPSHYDTRLGGKNVGKARRGLACVPGQASSLHPGATEGTPHRATCCWPSYAQAQPPPRTRLINAPSRAPGPPPPPQTGAAPPPKAVHRRWSRLNAHLGRGWCAPRHQRRRRRRRHLWDGARHPEVPCMKERRCSGGWLGPHGARPAGPGQQHRPRALIAGAPGLGRHSPTLCSSPTSGPWPSTVPMRLRQLYAEPAVENSGSVAAAGACGVGPGGACGAACLCSAGSTAGD